MKKTIFAFRKMIAESVLTGDCKLVVNGFIPKSVSIYEIVVDMLDSAGESYDTRYFRLDDLMEVTLLPDTTKLRCLFKNSYLPNEPNVVEIEVIKVNVIYNFYASWYYWLFGANIPLQHWTELR